MGGNADLRVLDTTFSTPPYDQGLEDGNTIASYSNQLLLQNVNFYQASMGQLGIRWFRGENCLMN